MAAYIKVAIFLFFYSALAGQNVGFLSRNRNRNTHRASFGFSYSMKDPVAQTLLTLDTDHNGRIEPNEIANYARMNGMDADAATQEFSSIDTNGDGFLESMELQSALGSATTEAATQANAAPVEVVPQSSFPDTIVPEVGDVSPTSSHSPSQKLASAMKDYASNAGAASQIESPVTSQVSASAVAQDALNQASQTEILEASSRQNALSAAQRVSEQLVLEEAEEKEARKFDQQAADMRSKSIALAKETSQDALNAGANAAHEEADGMLAQLSQMENQALAAEVKAAALNAKSKMELEEANSMMAIASKAMPTTFDKHA